MTDKFPHEFDKPIIQEREVDVYQMVMDEKTQQPKLRVVKSKVQESITYHNAPAQPLTCTKGQHNYVVIDKKKYIAKCMKCTKYWKMNPVHHKLQGGHILQRDHGYIID